MTTETETTQDNHISSGYNKNNSHNEEEDQGEYSASDEESQQELLQERSSNLVPAKKQRGYGYNGSRSRGRYFRGRRGGRGRGNFRYRRGGGQNRETSQNEPRRSYDGRRVLTVSAETPPKNLAGAISHICRDSESPILLAGGAGSVNQAIKAISIARSWLEQDKMDLLCFCESSNRRRFNRNQSNNFNGYRFTLSKCPLTKRQKQNRRNSSDEKNKDFEMKVSKSSVPGNVAGAIAKRVRDGQRITIVGIGPAAIFSAVQAISISRKYLYNDSWDLSFKPQFINVRLQENVESSAIEFHILSQHI